MWKNLQAFLSADATLELDGKGQLSLDERIMSVMAVLLRAAYSDGELGARELERSVATVASEFQVSEQQVRALVETADFLARDTKKLTSLINSVKEFLTDAQKVEVVKAVWRVLDADGKTQKAEAAFAAEMRKLLGLTLEQGFFASLARNRG